MFKSRYKSVEEIRFSLQPYQRLALFSCGVCANLADVGGIRGKHLMEGLLREWGKEVVTARVVSGCCVGTIMQDAVRKYIRPHRSMIDALMVISCAGGIKAACLYNPGLPVIAACDSYGSMPLTPRGAAHSDGNIICPGCEDSHCVLSYTAGICPVIECTAGRRYGPCEKAPRRGSKCAQDPSRTCAWKTIERAVQQRGRSLDALAELEVIHQGDGQRMPPVIRKPAPAPLQRLASTVMSGLPVPITRLLHSIR